ncbi:hypothetical protein GCM10011507_04300 [Edaphobacter acidisoli]|uniref:Flagellar protein FlgJ N-terminal domain-containing protein n=1 Tax=Edaphobacter acidisoli TaxID=2040573 RepID=A0A916RJK6_9BACT|nr:hypothetical protein [Edaphobacter acidisoli]GGA56148.1 hypothetical protein GCM10011507_04300 [Edaphobacter acidisoli]
MTISPVMTNPSVTSADRAKQAKLVDAAQQFEATMMQELLKPFSNSQDSWGIDAQDSDAGADTMSSFGTEAMAKAIAKNGGLGIARQVIQQVTQENQRIDEKKP